MHRYFRVALALAAALALQQDAAAQTNPGPEIVVTGNGIATFTPDRATLVVEVRTEAATPQEAGRKNAPVMETVLNALRRMGLAADRISTRGYTVQPIYRYDQTGPTLTGYAALNAVTVRLDRVERVGETLDTALAGGATRIGSVRFETSEHERVRRQALERAVSAARQDAETLARAAGGALGELVSLSTDARPTREELMSAAAASPSFARTGETPINAGEQTLVVTVQARWQFVKR